MQKLMNARSHSRKLTFRVSKLSSLVFCCDVLSPSYFLASVLRPLMLPFEF